MYIYIQTQYKDILHVYNYMPSLIGLKQLWCCSLLSRHRPGTAKAPGCCENCRDFLPDHPKNHHFVRLVKNSSSMEFWMFQMAFHQDLSQVNRPLSPRRPLVSKDCNLEDPKSKWQKHLPSFFNQQLYDHHSQSSIFTMFIPFSNLPSPPRSSHPLPWSSMVLSSNPTAPSAPLATFHWTLGQLDLWSVLESMVRVGTAVW